MFAKCAPFCLGGGVEQSTDPGSDLLTTKIPIETLFDSLALIGPVNVNVYAIMAVFVVLAAVSCIQRAP